MTVFENKYYDVRVNADATGYEMVHKEYGVVEHTAPVLIEVIMAAEQAMKMMDETLKPPATVRHIGSALQ